MTNLDCESEDVETDGTTLRRKRVSSWEPPNALADLVGEMVEAERAAFSLPTPLSPACALVRQF